MEKYDVIIIGAGVTGTAVARELSRYQIKTCVLEREEDVCCGTSKANSAIIHAGYDAEPGTLKAKLNVRGNLLIGELAEKLDVELWPDCPVTPFYSLLFKIMGLLNLLLFLYAILTLFSAKYDFIHLPVSLDTISLVALMTASALGIFGWKYLLCNLITAGAFLFLAFHVALSPVSLATDYTYTQLLSLIPAVVYMLHAGWLKLKKMKK